MLIVCTWPLIKGWQRRSRYQLIREIPTKTPATAEVGETALITGEVCRIDGQITSPVANETGALTAWSISEWHDESTQLKYWSPVARGLQSTTLRIGNDKQCVVLPDKGHEAATDSTTSIFGYGAVTGFEIEKHIVELDAFSTEEEIPQNEPPPERLRRMENQVGLEEPDEGMTLVDFGRTHGTRRYRETVLTEGDTITVRGTIATADQAGSPPVVTPPANGPIVLSNMDADSLAWRYRWNYWKLFYGGIAIVLTMMLLATLVVVGS